MATFLTGGIVWEPGHKGSFGFISVQATEFLLLFCVVSDHYDIFNSLCWLFCRNQREKLSEVGNTYCLFSSLSPVDPNWKD